MARQSSMRQDGAGRRKIQLEAQLKAEGWIVQSLRSSQ
jgi:hypothetical protein